MTVIQNGWCGDLKMQCGKYEDGYNSAYGFRNRFIRERNYSPAEQSVTIIYMLFIFSILTLL
ncbi:hypothetical protein JCM10550A_22110 [Methanogenium cariaci]